LKRDLIGVAHQLKNVIVLMMIKSEGVLLPKGMNLAEGFVYFIRERGLASLTMKHPSECGLLIKVELSSEGRGRLAEHILFIDHLKIKHLLEFIKIEFLLF
jgi:hypothetical protein